MQSELKPCPFCGDKPIIEDGANDRPWVVQCINRGCPAQPFMDHADTKRQAIAAWNYRTVDADSPQVQFDVPFETRASDAEITRLTEALRLQMETKHKEAAEAKLWFQKAQEWKEALRAAEEEKKGLREALVAIQNATIEGRVCDDVAWFDQITTLYDFIEAVLFPDPQAALGDLFDRSPSQEPSHD